MRGELWLYTIPLRFRSIFRRNRVEEELDEELRLHLELLTDQNLARGLDAAEARRQARMALDGVERCKEECRDMRRVNLADDLLRDLAYAVRLLRKSPAFTLTAVATIALGIGASTAIFSVTNAVLLRPLPYRNPDRLVLADTAFSNALYFDLRDTTKPAFEDVAAVMPYRAVVPREDGSAERITKGWVTTNFFRMMGARIAFGRDFTDEDGQPHGDPGPVFPWPEGRAAILSYEYFARRYGANPAVVGRDLPASAQARPRIVGVLAPGFRLYLPNGTTSDPSPDVWIANYRGYDAAHRGRLSLRVIGALRQNVSLDHAQAVIDASAAQWRRRQDFDFRPSFEFWHKKLVAEVRPAILALMGAVIFLLLIASANVANLVLVRASLRERELAVRAAIGAGWGRLARQMLAEAALLAGIGALFGVGLARIGLRLLIAIVPGNVPRLDTIAIDWRVLMFAATAGFFEAVLFSVLPGWRPALPDMMQILRAAGRSASSGTWRHLRSGVVVAEVALSFALLVGSGLMFRSFVALRRVNPGYDPRGLLTFLAIGDAKGFVEPARRVAFLSEVESRLRAMPGVQNVGASLSLPLAGMRAGEGTQWGTERTRLDPGEVLQCDVSMVMPGYFETLRTRLLEGRTFTASDNTGHRNYAVVDELLARRAFPNESAVGKRIFVVFGKPMWLEVIGVAAHQRLHSLAEPGREQVFLVDGFFGIGISRHWALRTAGDPAQYAAAVRSEMASIAPGRFALTEVQTMEAIVDRAEAGTQFHMVLIGVFAGIAALLAAVGLYGVLASAVRQRTTEIGVRMAMGATPVAIFRLVVGRGLALSATGIALDHGGLSRNRGGGFVGAGAEGGGAGCDGRPAGGVGRAAGSAREWQTTESDRPPHVRRPAARKSRKRPQEVRQEMRRPSSLPQFARGIRIRGQCSCRF
jgi:predicted permease